MEEMIPEEQRKQVIDRIIFLCRQAGINAFVLPEWISRSIFAKNPRLILGLAHSRGYEFADDNVGICAN